jgi:hypothetical protein
LLYAHNLRHCLAEDRLTSKGYKEPRFNKPGQKQEVNLDYYVDANFAGMWGYKDKQDMSCAKSWTALFVIFIQGCPVVWKSKLQTDVATLYYGEQIQCSKHEHAGCIAAESFDQSYVILPGLEQISLIKFKATIQQRKLKLLCLL